MNEIYVKFALLLLHTIQVFNCQDWHFQGPNVALEKHAEQFPGIYAQKLTADLAVDWNIGTTLYNGTRPQCSHTDAYENNQGASWRVDLGQSFIIKGIRIYNRTDNPYYANRLQNFKVTGVSDSDIPELLYYDGNSSRQMYNDPIINIKVTSKTPFLRINISIPARKHTKSYLTLCEVEIYPVLCNFPTALSPLQTESDSSPVMVPNSSDRKDARYFQPGTKIRFSCQTGSLTTLQGSQSLTCQDTESQYTYPKCEQDSQHEEEKQTMPIAVIVGTGAGGVLLGSVLVAVVVCVYIRRLKNRLGGSGVEAPVTRQDATNHEMDMFVNTSQAVPVVTSNNQTDGSHSQHTYETIPNNQFEDTEQDQTERRGTNDNREETLLTAEYIDMSLTSTTVHDYEQPSRPDSSQQHTYESLQDKNMRMFSEYM